SRAVVSSQLAAGPEVAHLERELSARAGHAHGVGVSSGTAALYCALRGLGVGKGDAVVIPTYVCAALFHAVDAAGAEPVLADVDPRTGNLRVEDVRKALRRNVKAVVVPHMFGSPAPASQIEALGVPVIEDCAQCVGTTASGRKVGSLTTVSVFSFYATKVVCAGEGGMVATSSKRLADAVRDSIEYDNRNKLQPRFNFKLSDVHAAVARAQLRKLRTMVARRRRIARLYRRNLTGAAGQENLPVEEQGSRPIYFRFVVKTPGRLQAVLRRANREGVSCARPVYKPLHRYLGTRGFPGAEAMHASALSIPLYPDMTDAEAARVVKVMREALRA
ncbi:MAG: hypothetical protein GF418_10210, partial [Chitinivibrionales bacterium]|nr:hypothetical protein [Chitinivibrionales bacterium]MBD3395986.1 hypothetical protein [Chitinivibrionales bacterium]